MLKPHKTTGRRATLVVLALILLILSVVYLIHEYQQISPKASRVAGKEETTQFFRLLLEGDKKVLSDKPSVKPETKETEIKEPEALMVKSIQLQPKHPTIADTIKAVSLSNYEDQKVSFEYKWYINNKFVEGIKDDTLPKGMFKKNDLISVSVTPIMDGKKGYAFISLPIIIQNSIPSLDMKEIPQNTKLADVIELQLIGTDPDGDKLTYALEQPTLGGMTINSETGKILWKPQKKEKGLYRFKASASDPDGGKIVRTFELEIK